MNLDPDRYGIREGINEVIVTTVSVDNRYNAAPIGIIRRDGKLTVRVYNESQTCTNIKNTGLLAANMVDDPVLFVQSALGSLDAGMYKVIETETGIRFPVLAHSSAWVLYKVDYKSGSIAITAELLPIAGNIGSFRIRPINRGFNAVIEATIHATRYNVFKNETYLAKIKSYSNIINKCGGSREKEAYELIFQLL